jgi:hypothetical protein
MHPSVSSAHKEAEGRSFEASLPHKMRCHSYFLSLLLSFFPEAQKYLVFLLPHMSIIGYSARENLEQILKLEKYHKNFVNARQKGSS